MRQREWIVALAATCGLGLVVLVSSAMAQTAPKPAAAAPPAAASPPAATPPAAAVAAAPSRTTASFGDWTLRCDRVADATPPKRSCELGLTVQHAGDQSVLAQVAVGRPAAGEPLRFTAVLPANISVGTAPKLAVEGKDAGAVEVAWVRCLPGGCIATAGVSDDLLRKLKAAAVAGQLEYRDAAGHEIKLPISWRGFGEAFEALGKEAVN
jgi:invasion protein IalB